MTWTLLILFISVFAIRGLFLGLTGVIARLLSILAGYYAAITLRGAVTELLSPLLPNTLPDLLIQITSAAILFFTAMILVSMIVTTSFSLTTKCFPAFKHLLSKHSISSRIAGGITNGLVATVIFLIGLWAYGLLVPGKSADDKLHQFANMFGNRIFTALSSNISLADTNNTAAAVTQHNRSNSQTIKGSAVIISTEDPQKKLTIETISRIATNASPDQLADMGQLLQQDSVRELLNNPELQQKAQQYLQQNPEQVEKLLSNPQFQSLLQQMGQANTVNSKP